MNLDRSIINQIILINQRIENIPNDTTITEIKLETQKVIDYLDDLRVEILKLDHKNCKTTSELNEPLNNEKATEYMFSSKHAFYLKDKIDAYKNYLKTKLSNDTIGNLIDHQLNTYAHIPRKKGEPGVSWESFQFDALPLIQCVVNLKMIELEIRTAESITIANITNNKNTFGNKPQ